MFKNLVILALLLTGHLQAGTWRTPDTAVFSGTTASTSSATGIIQSAGGIGISKTTDASSATNGGSLTTAGGAAIAKSLWVGTTSNFAGAATFTNTVNITPGSGNNTIVLTGPSSAANNSGEIIFKQAAQYSFLFGSGYNTAGALEIIPSTASGGTTFSNPIFQANRTGVLTLGSSTLLGSHITNGTITINTGSTDTVGLAVKSSNTTGVARWELGNSDLTKYFQTACDWTGGSESCGINFLTGGVTRTFATYSYNSQNVNFGLTTASSSSSTGAITTAGGIGISNTTDASSSTNGGTFTSAGGGGFAKKLYVGGTFTAEGAAVVGGSFTQTSVASSSTSGANWLAASTAKFKFKEAIGDSDGLQVFLTSGNSTINSSGATSLALQTNGTSRLTIASGGDTTLSGALTIGGNTTGDSNLGTISSVSNSSYYVGSFSVDFTGAFTATQTKTISYVKLGRLVLLEIPATSAACSVAATITSTAIPSSLRPNLAMAHAANGVFDNSGADVTARLTVSTAGVIVVAANSAGGAFSASGNCGWDRALDVAYYSSN